MEISIQIDSVQLVIINLHIDFSFRRSRMAQIDPILEGIGTLTKSSTPPPPLIYGDFNTEKTRLNDAIRQFLIRSAEHLHYTYHPKNKLTYPTQFPSRGLDFILVPKPFVVRKASVIKSFASFRLPVVAEIIAPCSTEISVSEPNTQRD